MLDTVKIRSPYLSEDVARAVEYHLERRSAVRLADDLLLYEFTSGPLTGTWDHRIRVQVEREEWVNVEAFARRLGGRAVVHGRQAPVKRSCPPYLVVEGSVHKAMLGHNVYGGPGDVVAPVRWLVADMARRMAVELPDGARWRLRRVDWAHMYDLGSVEACQEFVSYLHNVKFPRRKVSRFEDESVMVAGDTTSLKVYHKGPEFQKHDHRRVAQFGDVAAIQGRANMLLRVEVEIHASAIDGEYAAPAVANVTVDWIESIHGRDIGRLIREGSSAMKTVRTAAAVKKRLYKTYSARQARALYGTWLELAAMGEKSVRSSLTRTTFYDHRKMLVDAGCSWHDTNVKLDDRLRLVPEDFVPLPHDPRCVDVEDPAIAAALAPFRQAG